MKSKINITGTLAAFALLGGLIIASLLAEAKGPPFTELTWGDDALFEILAPKVPVPADPASEEPFYIIGTVGTTQAPYGPFDHVIEIPPQNHGEFSAIWHIYWLELGPNAVLGVNVEARFATTPFGLTAGEDTYFVYAADLSGTGTLEPLTSVEKIEQAVELGLATEVDAGIVFTCPVVPTHVLQ